MNGHIDRCTRAEIAGWAIAEGSERAELVVEADGEIVGVVSAGEFRKDLGRPCGFRLSFAKPLANPNQVRVYFAGTKTDLANSPLEFKHRLPPLRAADAAWAETLPLPPLEEMRLIGSETAEIFVAQGSRAALVLRDHLLEFFGAIDPVHRILDFGCGVGRALLPLSRRHPAKWFGCDVNDRAIDYLKMAVPDVEAVATAYDPPLPFPDDGFDCVISVSVWTHLPIGRHLPWLAEIRRVLRPGGLALISTSGPHVLDVRRRRGDAGWEDLHPVDLEAAGVIYKPYGQGGLRGITGSYGLAAHHPRHVQRVWSTIMPVLKTTERALEAMQDLHMLTKL